jgi:phosphatidate cytidylyltransferase
MMTTRILTAAALIALIMAALFFLPRTGWLLLAAVMLAQGAWEWGALARLGAVPRAVYTMALVIAFLWLVYDPEPAYTRCAYYVAAVFWAVLAPLWLWRRPAFRSAGVPLAAGAIVLVPAFMALVLLRDDDGPLLLLAVMVAIWISDTAALFTGRRFGRHKLAPEVSPGKTWEGVYGALAAVAAYGGLTAWLFTSAESPAFRPSAYVPWILTLLVLAIGGVIGDLFESQMKRAAGVKDSGSLLPGHGGWLDRIDAQTAALPLAALAFTLWAP